MAGAIQYFENAAHDFVFALDRLIGIGVGADRDHARLVTRGSQFLLEQFRRVRLDQQLGFEIESGRQAEKRMRRPREAVDAAMLTTAIRIDRTVESDVGRVVEGNDLARGIERYRGLEWRQVVQALPAIVEGDPRFSLEPAARVGLRATATLSLAVDRDRKLGKRCRTRRFGGRRDRRVLEGMRGCSAHEANIARQRNKSRTSSTTIHNEARMSEKACAPDAAKNCTPTAALIVTR